MKNYTFKLNPKTMFMITKIIKSTEPKYRSQSHFVEMAIHNQIKSDITTMQFYDEIDLKRFWSKVEKTQACWNWIPGKKDNYGQFSYNSQNVQAHRFSYELHFGPIPLNMTVRHTCHNKKCVNPEHLEIGTQKDNMIDEFIRRTNIVKYLKNKEKIMRIRNLTPHTIKYDDGKTKQITFPSEGELRVKPQLQEIDKDDGRFVDLGLSLVHAFGEISGIPQDIHWEDVLIVSRAAAAELATSRYEKIPDGITLLIPDTGETSQRDSNGNVVSVSRFIKTSALNREYSCQG